MDDTLLAAIEKFCTDHDLSERQFGDLALNDSHFVRDLRKDREPRRKTVERVCEFMAGYVPLAKAS